MNAFHPVHITPATDVDVPLTSRLIVTAFRHLEVVKWLVDDPADVEWALRRHLGLHVENAITGKQGHADITLARTGVTVWFHSDGSEIPPPADYDSNLDEVCGRYADRFREFDRALAAHHPVGVAHHHLAFAAVDPEHQRRGLGTALLHHHHRHLDEQGIAGYLEASSEDSARLYERLGYRRLAPYTLGDTATFMPMWREPSPSRPPTAGPTDS